MAFDSAPPPYLWSHPNLNAYNEQFEGWPIAPSTRNSDTSAASTCGGPPVSNRPHVGPFRTLSHSLDTMPLVSLVPQMPRSRVGRRQVYSGTKIQD